MSWRVDQSSASPLPPSSGIVGSPTMSGGAYLGYAFVSYCIVALLEDSSRYASEQGVVGCGSCMSYVVYLAGEESMHF